MSSRASTTLLTLLFASAVLAASGQIFLKLGAQGRSELTAFVNPWIAVGVLCYGLGMVIWVFALSKSPLTVVYPFTALTFVLVYLAGLLIFKEAFSIRSLAGVLLIVSGLYLVVSR